MVPSVYGTSNRQQNSSPPFPASWQTFTAPAGVVEISPPYPFPRRIKVQRNFLMNSAIMTTLSLCLALPATAQRNEQQTRRPDADQQRQSQQDSRSRSQTQRQLQLDPLGRVVIGVDSDGDNRFEAIEAINYYELEMAKKRSAERRSQAGQQRDDRQQQFTRSQPMDQQRDSSRSMRSDQGRPSGQRSSQSQQPRQQMAKVTGTVTAIDTFRMVDGPKHLFAKIETKKGDQIPVDLGRAEQLQRLDIQDGDRITVYGTHTRMNDKRVVSARKVQVGDKSMMVGREKDRDLKRVQGEITRLFTRSFRGRDQQFDVAKVELNGGRMETVILGPANRLRNLDLQEGDTVQLLVRRGRYNDEPALIADQVRAGEQTVRVTEPEGRRFTAQQDRRRN